MIRPSFQNIKNSVWTRSDLAGAVTFGARKILSALLETASSTTWLGQFPKSHLEEVNHSRTAAKSTRQLSSQGCRTWRQQTWIWGPTVFFSATTFWTVLSFNHRNLTDWKHLSWYSSWPNSFAVFRHNLLKATQGKEHGTKTMSKSGLLPCLLRPCASQDIPCCGTYLWLQGSQGAEPLPSQRPVLL